MAVNQIQTLLNITGTIQGQSDSIAITENPLLTVTTPNLTSGGLVSTGTLNKEIIAAAQADSYLFVKNAGLNGGGTGTNLTEITLSAGTSIATLKVGEFAFFPLKTGGGAKIKFISGTAANIVYAYFARA
jgi:hypothetical protein